VPEARCAKAYDFVRLASGTEMKENAICSPVTLRDIATELRVSHSTVSRALQNASNISLARRQQIQEVARRMGYRPNAMATRLGHQRHAHHKRPISSEIAWVNFWPQPDKLRSYEEFNLYWKGASERAEESGYRLEQFICDDRLSPGRLEKILLARNIHGILLPPHGIPPPVGWDKIDWDKFSIVRFGYSVPRPRAHLVTSNHLTCGMLALDNMWRLGYNRVGFVGKIDKHPQFRAGFLLKEVLHAKVPPSIFTFLTSQNYQEELPAFSKWLKKSRLDAILSDAAETRLMLDQLGLRVPEDIGLASTSILDGNAAAGIDQNSEEIGKAATETLIALLNHNQYGIPKIVREVLITGTWVDGATLPPRT
jgi:LacI family transcriptional regulator